ncbi:MAG: Glu-tRNA(Gln) amidotransferase subunit GatE [Candidatus Heimdallarchaeota archaeon]
MIKHDYKSLGFKAGIEIHAQLNTKQKLFCDCPVILRTDEPDFEIKRYFRPVISELGEYDRSSLLEFKKNLTIIYEGHYNTSCTYELDETPPFNLNREALDIALFLALILRCSVRDEIYVCRKNYLDGSVPCGFQRTCLIGSNGLIPVSDLKNVNIWYVYLEEDAARKNTETSKGKEVHYRIDRLGFPMVEIVTGPDLMNPDEVVICAKRLGMILRSFGLSRRGLGTIRQDINVSIAAGARVELKGVQQLDLIPVAIDMEITRQLALIELMKKANELSSKRKITNNPVDVTEVLKETKCGFVREALTKGQYALALRIPGFSGLLGKEIQLKRRLGTELADRVRSLTTLQGILHSDENLISYGFSTNELEKLYEISNKTQQDAIILVVGPKKEAQRALAYVVERILQVFDGVLNETREVDSETGTSRFTRELPGKARLYPDTDSEPISLASSYIKQIHSRLPEYPWNSVQWIIEEFNIPEQIASEIVYEDLFSLFKETIAEFKLDPTLIAITLTQTIKALARDHVPVHNLTEKHLKAVFRFLSNKKIAKEAIPDVLAIWACEPSLQIDAVVQKLGLTTLGIEELENIVKTIVEKNHEQIRDRGMKAFAAIMGDVMKEVRGKIDGKTVSESVKKAIQAKLTDTRQAAA